uniref:Major facilitator superfamily (MFS) profile domain-containing protein n=1 Tax=Hemiselmis tepida TaxID=464990 RepID=A0A7S0YXR6_9CRYP|eukprot:CAMPEP_0174922616 /NCGR_PEP_ID=MMETSP1355-20121228/6001_1 /TAXON_ID=464990 /ORGANISM="Hemiselmis tepida, Strain CCMP443" /LENGTH=479 /DNA_ID=CAMNT_0016168225 /DNA_START=35 /DNA_END=1474 /DNA_ORIENTATION=-
MTVGGSGKPHPSGLPTVEDQLNHIGMGNKHWFLFFISSLLVAADGMEMVVISLLHDPLRREWNLDELGFASLGSVVFAGLLVGNLTGGLFADKFGRRNTLLAVSMVFGVGGLASALAVDVMTFAICRFITGIGVGSMIPVADSLMIEWSPTEWRGRLAMLLTGVAFALGSMFACLVGIVMHDLFAGEGAWWRYMVLVCVLPGIVSLPLMYLYLPESPHWLMVQGRREEAEEEIALFAKANGVEPLQGGKVAPLDHGPHEVASLEHLSGLFSGRLIKSTVFITVAYTVCGFVYYGHIFIYPILLEEEYHMEVREAYGTMMIGVVVEIATVLACMVIMDVPGIGRRGAMASGFVACFVVSCLVTISQNVSQFVFLNSAVRALIEGPFTVIYIYAGELLPSSHRATGISFCNSFGRIAAMGAPVATTWAEESSIIVVFGLFAAASGLGVLSIVLFKKETLGKPLAELVEDVEDEDEEQRPLL